MKWIKERLKKQGKIDGLILDVLRNRKEKTTMTDLEVFKMNYHNQIR